MRITKDKLKDLVTEALNNLDGSGSVLEVCKYIWEKYEADIKNSGDILYTLQYDVRWAAQKLRNSGILKPVHGSKNLPWELA